MHARRDQPLAHAVSTTRPTVTASWPQNRVYIPLTYVSLVLLIVLASLDLGNLGAAHTARESGTEDYRRASQQRVIVMEIMVKAGQNNQNYNATHVDFDHTREYFTGNID